MHRGIRIAVLAAIGMVIACPVGFAVGNEQGGDSGTGQQPVILPENIYAQIPPEPISPELVDMCQAKLVDHPDDNCRIFVRIGEKQAEGLIQPGNYTKEELESILDMKLP